MSFLPQRVCVEATREERKEKIIWLLIRLNPEKILEINPYNIPFFQI